MLREKAKLILAGLCAWAAKELQHDKPQEDREETEYRVAITNAGEPVIEVVRASSLEQAAERAANAFAHRRLASTNERSWRVKALVNDSQFDIDVSYYLHAEICGK